MTHLARAAVNRTVSYYVLPPLAAAILLGVEHVATLSKVAEGKWVTEYVGFDSKNAQPAQPKLGDRVTRLRLSVPAGDQPVKFFIDEPILYEAGEPAK